jgi:DNA-binding HxlR family transcriptional regulator
MTSSLDDKAEAEFKRLSELLLKRGFVRRFVYHHAPHRTSEFEFTPEGLALRKLLKKLFDIPNINAVDLTTDNIADMIMIILLTSDTM